ncbi:hypothetical protein [Agromyces sp. PvR057]|uniref:hypothetical protein n=1 Tax=Agromyces sp. PvR057 TaxID=3156403 RepID=UPI0033907C2B
MTGLVDGWDGPALDLMNDSPAIGWLSDDEFGVVTIGSSSCPVVAERVQVLASDELQIDFGPSPHDPCTADAAATTHVFELPSTVDGRPVTVRIQYEDGTKHLLELR